MDAAYLWIHRPRPPGNCQLDCPIENKKWYLRERTRIITQLHWPRNIFYSRSDSQVGNYQEGGFFAMFVPISYVVVEAQADGVNRELAGYLLTILNAAR
jgi:hypothetical protein